MGDKESGRDRIEVEQTETVQTKRYRQAEANGVPNEGQIALYRLGDGVRCRGEGSRLCTPEAELGKMQQPAMQRQWSPSKPARWTGLALALAWLGSRLLLVLVSGGGDDPRSTE